MRKRFLRITLSLALSLSMLPAFSLPAVAAEGNKAIMWGTDGIEGDKAIMWGAEGIDGDKAIMWGTDGIDGDKAIMWGTDGIDGNKAIMWGAEGIDGGGADYVYFGNYQQSSHTPTTAPASPAEGMVYTDTDEAETQFVYVASPANGVGNYFKIEPVKWRVLDNNNDYNTENSTTESALFLLSEQNLDVRQYDTIYPDYTGAWAGSSLRSWLNQTTSGGFYADAFAKKEQAAIAETTVKNTDGNKYDPDISAGEDTKDKVFALSEVEAETTAYGFTDNYKSTDTRKATNTDYTKSRGVHIYTGFDTGTWWLRSPGRSDNYAANVNYSGYLFDIGGAVIYDDIAVRPAFNLDLSSVLFTSAAAATAQTDFAAAQAYDGNEWKLTLKDSNDFSRDASVSGTTTLATGYSDATLTVTHAALDSFTNAGYTNVTAALTDSSGELLYYGSLNSDTSATSSTVTIPAGLAAGDYTLSVYGEDWNGANYTDYATGMPFTTTISVHEHHWSADWSTDDTGHWHECKNSGCPVTENSGKDGYGLHLSTSDGGECVCGYTFYSVWVGGVQVSGMPDENGNIDVTAGITSGTVTLTPAAGTVDDPETSVIENAPTCTVSDASIIAAAVAVEENYNPVRGIYSQKDLNMVLTGTNTITVSSNDNYSAGVVADAVRLTVSGNGSLAISGGDWGIFAGNLEVDGVTITIDSGYAILLNTGATITDSTVSAVGSVTGISTTTKTIEINDSSVYVKGGTNSFDGVTSEVSVSLNGGTHVKAEGAIDVAGGMGSSDSGYLCTDSDGTFVHKDDGSLETGNGYFEYVGKSHYTASANIGSEEHTIHCTDENCILKLTSTAASHIWNENADGATCAHCKAAAAASVSASSTTTYYHDFDTALGAAEGASDSTLKLFDDVGTVTLSTGGFTLDPNGKSITKLNFRYGSQRIGIISRPANTPAVEMANYGVFATPADGIELEAEWFTSDMKGYLVVKDGNNLKLTEGITEDMVEISEDVTYNGSPQPPTVTVKWTDGNGPSMILTEGINYVVSYRDSEGNPVASPTNADTYTVTITGKDQAGKVEKTYTISPRSLKSATVNAPSQTYTGSKLTPAVTVTAIDCDIEAADYDVSYSPDTLINAGNYNITITGKGNFTDTAYGTFAIMPVNISGQTANSPDQITIFGKGDFTEPTIPGVAGETVAGTFQYSIIAANGATGVTDGDAAAVKASLATLEKNKDVVVDWTFSPTTGNYTGTKAGSFTVTAKDIEFKVGSETASAVNAINVLTSSTEYGKTWNERISVKSDSITASVDGIPVSGTYTIAPGDGALTDRPGVGTHSYTVTFTGDEYFNVTVFTGELTVVKKVVTVAPKAVAVTVNGTAMLELAYTGLVNGETITPDSVELKLYKSDGTEISVADAVKVAGTYTIKWINYNTVNFLDAENYYVSKRETARFVVRQQSSGGQGGGYMPPTTSVTIPISGEENSIDVEASVSGSKATLDDVDFFKLDTVIGEDVDTGVVTIDFSGLNKDVDTVEIPSDVVKQISEAVSNPNNDAESLEVVLSDGTSIDFDAAALGEKAAQADGLNISYP